MKQHSDKIFSPRNDRHFHLKYLLSSFCGHACEVWNNIFTKLTLKNSIYFMHILVLLFLIAIDECNTPISIKYAEWLKLCHQHYNLKL